MGKITENQARLLYETASDPMFVGTKRKAKFIDVLFDQNNGVRSDGTGFNGEAKEFWVDLVLPEDVKGRFIYDVRAYTSLTLAAPTQTADGDKFIFYTGRDKENLEEKVVLDHNLELNHIIRYDETKKYLRIKVIFQNAPATTDWLKLRLYFEEAY